MIARLVAATLFAGWIFWQIPLGSTHELRLPEISTHATFKDAPVNGESALTFFRQTSPGQYEAHGVSAAGQIVKSIRLPGESLSKADGTTISLGGKVGYLSAPDNGSFFVWYPQIGQQVFVFNEQGSFLWEKDESHYLHVLPRGRYIMAAAGDHSRMLFMNPDFKVQADFQGVLFTRYVTDDNPDLQSAQVCLGSLDGDVIVAHLDRKEHMRQRLGYALKSLTCDFTTGTLAAIVERKVEVEKSIVHKDFLVRARFNLSKKDLDFFAESELPVRTTSASPLILTSEIVCFIQKLTATESAVFYATGKSARLKTLPLANVTDIKPEEWRSSSQRMNKGETACLFAHKSGRLVYANARGVLLDRNDLPAIRVLSSGEVAYLQGSDGVTTLR